MGVRHKIAYPIIILRFVLSDNWIGVLVPQHALGML